jgi:hypothetical protein
MKVIASIECVQLLFLLRSPVHMTKSPFALSLSKGMSEWAQGFDKLSPNGD